MTRGQITIDSAGTTDRHEPDAIPFLKWAGGKTQLLTQYADLFPSSFGTYFEPFLGGAAVFFRLQPKDALLTDVNDELINAYIVVRDKVEELLESLATHEVTPEYYYRIRAGHPEELDPVARASRLIYLNKTCYNGLYRVNRAGRFNVPYGQYKNPRIVNQRVLRAASRVLQGKVIRTMDFEEAIAEAQAYDLVYMDPPYQPLSRTSNFTNYAEDGFGVVEQERLASVVRDLAQRHVLVMLSNSDTPLVRDLYSGFSIVQVSAKRAINCRGSQRGSITEVVIRNYGNE